MEKKVKEFEQNENFLYKLESTTGDVEKNLRRLETSLTFGTIKPKPKKILGYKEDLELERLSNHYKNERLKETVKRVQESNFDRINKLIIQVKNEKKKSYMRFY